MGIYGELLSEIELIRRALALKHRIGALYSHNDAFYLTPVEIDISDPFGSARRVSRAQLRQIGAAAELEEAHAGLPGAVREKMVEIHQDLLAFKSNRSRNDFAVREHCIPSAGISTPDLPFLEANKVVLPRADVLIENPLPGGSNKTNLNRARRYVRQGRAAFVGAGERVIRFGKYKPM